MDLLIAGRRMKAFWLIFWIFLKIARFPIVVQGSLRSFMLKARKVPDQRVARIMRAAGIQVIRISLVFHITPPG